MPKFREFFPTTFVFILDMFYIHIFVEFCEKKPLYNKHPTNCEKYIICAGPIGVHILKCPEELHWDSKRRICNWKQFAGCGMSLSFYKYL